MKPMGWNHVDLATTNMAATRAFYEGILGFPVVRADRVGFEGSDGFAEHVFFDCGNGQMIAFASAEHAPNRWPKGFDPSINKPLGLPRGVYHFAFEAGSLENLLKLKETLETKGIAVRGVEDHEGWCRSIYFEDPNGLQLEYCCLSRPLTEEDTKAEIRFRVSKQGTKLPA